MKPLDAELDRRMADAIKARGPVEQSFQRDEFKAAQPYLNVLYAVIVILFITGALS